MPLCVCFTIGRGMSAGCGAGARRAESDEVRYNGRTFLIRKGLKLPSAEPTGKRIPENRDEFDGFLQRISHTLRTDINAYLS